MAHLSLLAACLPMNLWAAFCCSRQHRRKRRWGDYLLLLGWSFWVGSQVYSYLGYISTKNIQRPSGTWLERRSLLGSSCEPLVSRIAAVSYTFTKENPPESLYADVSRSCVIYRVKSSIEVWHIANQISTRQGIQTDGVMDMLRMQSNCTLRFPAIWSSLQCHGTPCLGAFGYHLSSAR